MAKQRVNISMVCLPATFQDEEWKKQLFQSEYSETRQEKEKNKPFSVLTCLDEHTNANLGFE